MAKGQENCVIYRRRNAIPFNSYESPATGKYLRWFLSVTGESMRMRNLLFGAVCMAIYLPINAIADASVCEEEYRTCMEQQGMSVDEYFVTDGQDAVFLADAEMQAQLDEIKEALTGRDYPFVQSLDALPIERQMRRVRGYLADKSFQYYKNKYMAMLQDMSELTGRAIKTQNTDGQENLWLDRGQLDNMDVCYNLLERQACDYPDGFLEFSVTHNTREPQSLLVQMDSPETNTHYSISIQLTNDSTMAFSSELYAQYDDIRLRVMAEEYDYDDWYVWRNQEVADIRAGKYIPMPDGEQPDENSPFGAMAIKMDDSREWESNNLPSVRAKGRIQEYSASDTSTFGR